MCLGAHCRCLVPFPALADDAAASFPAHAIIISFTTEIINAFVLDCMYAYNQVFLCACMLRLEFRPLLGHYSATTRPEILVTIGQFQVDNESLLEYNGLWDGVCYNTVIGHKACSEAFLRVNDHVSSET